VILRRPTTTKEAIGDYSYSVSHFVFQDRFYKNQRFFAGGGDLMADHLRSPVFTRLLENIFSYPYASEGKDKDGIFAPARKYKNPQLSRNRFCRLMAHEKLRIYALT